MIGGTGCGANGSEDALHFVSNIEPAGVLLRDIPLRQIGADVVVSRNVQDLRLWTPRFGRPVLAAADAWAESSALPGARTLRFICGRSPRLRVNRREHIVVGEREGVEKLQPPLFAIQNPEVSIAAGIDRKSTRLNSSHSQISYAVFCLKKKNSSTATRARLSTGTSQSGSTTDCL